MRSERFDFAGADGQKLAARLDLPDGTPAAYSLFAHCFTCSKDSLAASRIARTLAEQAGIATLRFDFTGLGSSEGEFANTGFSSNVADLLAAVSHMRARNAAPALLIGHSLGGAAVLAAASEVPEARAVVTISAPCNADHVTKLLGESRAEIETRGEATVLLGGRPFTIRRAFLEDVGSQDQAGRIARLNRALLVMHAPADATVGIENASAIYGKARHPKSFVSLDDADHLLTRPGDAEYAARVLAAWASRYVGAAAQEPVATMGEGEVLVESGAGRFGQRITAGRHRILADEPMALGGDDTGPSPYELLLAGLGACTAMTIKLYAERKGLPLRGVGVRLRHDRNHAEDCAECEDGLRRLELIEAEVSLDGELDEAQRARLMEIADKCPVHRTLEGGVTMRTVPALRDRG